MKEAYGESASNFFRQVPLYKAYYIKSELPEVKNLVIIQFPILQKLISLLR